MDDYLAALARRRTARHAREPHVVRTETDEPRFSLSTLPFLVLFAALGVIAVGIMIAAWPGAQPEHKPRVEPKKELGTAPKGWLEEAEKEMNR